MKGTLFIFMFLIIGSFFISCTRDIGLIVPVDFRDKYVGRYKGVATKIHSFYSTFSNTTSRDTTTNSDSTLIITKVGDYPSKEISMNGGTSFTLSNSNQNDIGGYAGGYTNVSFKFPTIHVYGSGSGVSNEYDEWDFKGTKQ